MPDVEFQRALPAADLAPNSMRAVTLGARELLLCHVKDGLYAVDNICTHGYARLDEGRLRGVRVICPLHGASFDCRNGSVLGAPASQPLRGYPVRVVADWIEVGIPAAT